MYQTLSVFFQFNHKFEDDFMSIRVELNVTYKFLTLNI